MTPSSASAAVGVSRIATRRGVSGFSSIGATGEKSELAPGSSTGATGATVSIREGCVGSAEINPGSMTRAGASSPINHAPLSSVGLMVRRDVSKFQDATPFPSRFG